MSKLTNKYIDISYNALKLEGIDINKQEVYELLNNKDVISLSDIDKYIAMNFINSLSYINSIIDKGFDKYSLFGYIKRINLYLLNGLHSEAGNIRNSNIKVSGFRYIPNIPIEFEVREDIMKNIDELIKDPLELYCYITRNQIFADGNKRTSLLIVNLLLYIQNKYFSINEENESEYRAELITMYETNNRGRFKEYMKNILKIMTSKWNGVKIKVVQNHLYCFT